MQQVGGVHELEALQVLVDDVLLVDVFKDVGPDDSVQVSIHEVENEVDVAIVLSSDHVLQSDYILVARQLLQENDLAEGPLRIRSILESVEVLLERDNLFGSFIDGLPDDTVGSLSYLRQPDTQKVMTVNISQSDETLRVVLEGRVLGSRANSNSSQRPIVR